MSNHTSFPLNAGDLCPGVCCNPVRVYAPCEHESMSTSFEDSNLWSCDDCGVDVPKTAEEIDWFRTDGVPTCMICGHSEQFGGPMTERTPWLSKHPQTFHVSCLNK